MPTRSAPARPGPEVTAMASRSARVTGLGEGGADDGDDGAEVFAAGELGNDSTIACVGCDLGGDSGGESAGALLDDGGGGLITGGFDGEDEAVAGHLI